MTSGNCFSDLDMSSDAALVDSVGSVLAMPRDDPADSFVLHSALELCARSALLPYVAIGRRDEARQRLVDLSTGFESFGTAVNEPAEVEHDSLEVGADRLIAALGRGELDDVDAHSRWLGIRATPGQLQALLADAVLASLAAAAHAPIFLYLLPRVAPRGELSALLLRGLARELARAPGWQLAWIDRRRAVEADALGGGDVFAALARTPALGTPASTFIFPLMSRVDSDELAGAVLGPSCGPGEVAARGRAVLRAAAWSMIAEPNEHAPYGWSHALTMSQGALGIADACVDPSRALAVAATYVMGFRTLAERPLCAAMPDAMRSASGATAGLTFDESIEGGPVLAASVAWGRSMVDRRGLMRDLATAAAVHADAHLVKYTLACFDAASADADAAQVHLTAAATLAGWWAVNPRSAS